MLQIALAMCLNLWILLCEYYSTRFFIRKKFIRKWGSNRQNLKKILRKSRGSISKSKCFIGQNSIFRRSCINNIKDGIQIQVYNINNDTAYHFSQYITVKIEKI